MIDSLYQFPDAFTFVQAVRLVDWQHFYLKQQQPTLAKRPNGHDFLPEQEQLRFTAESNLTYYPTDIISLRQTRPKRPDVMRVSFMGLTGVHGSLPIYATEELLFSLYYNEFALRDFYDLFNHRSISLYSVASRKHRVELDYEAARRDNAQASAWRSDLFSQSMERLLGITHPKLTTIHPDTLLYYTLLFSSKTRSAGRLAQLLSDYFELSVQIQELETQYQNLPKKQQLRLSCIDQQGQFNQLGVDTLLGSGYYECQSRFRIRIGPLGGKQLSDFLPTGRAYAALVELTRLYVDPSLSFDIELTKENAITSDLSLSERNPPRLGWDSYMAMTAKAAINRPIEPIILSVSTRS